MGVPRPFHRLFRPVSANLPNAGYSGWAYIRDPEYAVAPAQYVRAYRLIESDLSRLFEYVEPSEEALNTFSYRIHELLMRTCIEIEANFKAILSENIYTPELDRFGQPILNMRVFRRIEQSHHLSAYEVALPAWNGPRRVLRPFAAWRGRGGLPWYQAYNASKHNRSEQFREANFEHLLDAVAGLVVVLSSQFKQEDFGSQADYLTVSGYGVDDMDSAIGQTFRIRFPNDWTNEEEYAFDWTELRGEAVRFDRYDYDAAAP